MPLIYRIKVHGLTEVADGKDASAAKGVKRVSGLTLHTNNLKKLV